MEILLLKCGELVLKGLNRNKFEERVCTDLRHRLKCCGDCTIKIMQSTIYVTPTDEFFDVDRAVDISRKVFGIVSICRAAMCEKNMDDIYALTCDYLADDLRGASTFKVEAKRSDKKFPLNSMEIMRETGSAILSRFPHLKVDVRNPELTVYVEVRDKNAFVHAAPIPGAGGLPSGINGRVSILISGGIDSPVAAYMMARRGLALHAVHFFSYPYTSERAKEKVITLLEKVASYAGRIHLDIVPFTKIQEEIRDKCPEDLFTLVMRRFMMRISQRLAADNDSYALVTGESMGQVASQTLHAIATTDAVCDIPVFRPVIGMDKTEIVEIARKIDTFETSILPYEDCCTVFTPKHPQTKPTVAMLEEAEANLDVDSLIDEAVAAVEHLRIQ